MYSNQKKLDLLAELFGMDKGDLKPDMQLSKLSNWNQDTENSLILQCAKGPISENIIFNTVQDILDFIG